ncbi:MAG: pilus assembly FimT family protein [Candidatus Methylomirabilales bacterium]
MRQVTQRNRSSRAIPGDTGGVTVVELVVGLLIAGILVAVALPLFSTIFEFSRLDGAARKIAGDLRYTQSLAVTRGGLFRLNTATSACTTVSGQTRYRIEWDPVELPPLPPVAAWQAFTECYLLSSEFRGATLTSITGSGGAPAITLVRFNSRGICENCTGGGVTPPIIVRVSNPSGTTRDVQVRTTGSVRIP